MPIISPRGLLALAGAAVAGLVAGPAHAQLIIVPTFSNSITSDPNAAAIEGTINQAINVYESTFTNNITVNITYGEMSTGLGMSSTGIVLESYANVLAALGANANTANALAAVASLPGGASNPVNGNAQLWLTTANARALGFSAATAVDSDVSINTSITNDSAPFNQNGSDYSLLAVVEHETDEALGLGSGLNIVGQDFDGFNPYTLDDPIRLQDLFRYTAPGVRSYNQNTNTSAYFSIDGGTTNLVNFNQNNDGSDYGDWINGDSPPKVQDAYGSPGGTENLLNDGGVELEGLNVQGYMEAPTRQSNGTPEPGSLALFIATGVLGTTAGIRRKIAKRSA